MVLQRTKYVHQVMSCNVDHTTYEVNQGGFWFFCAKDEVRLALDFVDPALPKERIQGDRVK